MAQITPLVVDEALSKVRNVQAHVEEALLAFADCAAVGTSAADQTLQSLERAQQAIQQLQQLAPELQRLSANQQQQQQQQRQADTSQAQQQGQSNERATHAQQHAQHFAEVFRRQVAASVGSLPNRSHWKMQSSCPQPTGRPPGYNLGRALQQVAAAAPGLQLHLFCSSSNKHCLNHQEGKHPYSDPAVMGVIAKCQMWVDEVRLVCPGVFVASIALAAPGSLQPVRVCLDSVDQVSSIDPWSTSKHQVFRRVSNLAVRAMHHFQQLEAVQALLEPAITEQQQSAATTAAIAPKPCNNSDTPAGNTIAAAGCGGSSNGHHRDHADGVALKCLLLWLACYDDLFSRRCDVSGTLIAWEPGTAIPLPPIVRPYWLSLEGLADAARDPSKRKAYHYHLAPLPSASTAAPAAAPALFSTCSASSMQHSLFRVDAHDAAWGPAGPEAGAWFAPVAPEEQLMAHYASLYA